MMKQQDSEVGRYETLRSKQQRCHDGAIWCCCFAGKLLATGSIDETVKLWTIDDHFGLHEEAKLAGNSLGVIDIDVFGGRLVSSSMDSQLRLWDIETRRMLNQIPPEDKEQPLSTWMCAFSPDGKLIATGGKGGCVDLYSVDTRVKVTSLQTRNKFVLNLAPSPCGRYLACSSPNGSVTVFDMAACKILRTFEDHALAVRTLAFSSDCKLLATGADDGLVKLYQGYGSACPDETFPDVVTLAGHNGWVLSLDFSADNEFLASGSTDNSVHVWALNKSDNQDDELEENNGEKSHQTVHEGHVWAVKFDDDSLLVSVSADESIALYQ